MSVSQETIIIVLYYSVQSEVSAVRKLESPLVGSFFWYTNIGKSIHAWSCVRYNVWVRYSERPLRKSWLYSIYYVLWLCFVIYVLLVI